MLDRTSTVPFRARVLPLFERYVHNPAGEEPVPIWVGALGPNQVALTARKGYHLLAGDSLGAYDGTNSASSMRTSRTLSASMWKPWSSTRCASSRLCRTATHAIASD